MSTSRRTTIRRVGCLRYIFKRYLYCKESKLVHVVRTRLTFDMISRHHSSIQKRNLIERLMKTGSEPADDGIHPTVLMVDGLRVLFTRDFDWQLKEHAYLFPRSAQDLPSFTYYESIHHILEIAHLGILLESFAIPKMVDNRNFGEFERCSQELQIYPEQMKISIDIPALFVDLSIETIYLMSSLLSIFSETQAMQNVRIKLLIAYN